MGGATGGTDRELRLLGAVVGGLQHRPLVAQQLRQRQAAVDRSLGVVGKQNQGVLREEGIEAAGRFDELREAVVSLGDRLQARLGPVPVGVVVVVGQREQEEVEWSCLPSSAAQQAE